MFNQYSGGNNTVHINAVTGAIIKNYNKSWFERFHLQSKRAKELLTRGNNTVVLQMVVCGDMEVMAECISRQDFEAQREQEGE